MTLYSKKFYDEQKENSVESASVIVPLLLQLIKPKSVIDVGCGLGTWAGIFEKHGVDTYGVDGQWVNAPDLQFNQLKFFPVDLKHSFKNRYNAINRKFDMAMSVEVAEHLPKESAETFVKSLTELSDVVVFSAAIPYQGGTDHINEQFQDYWAKLFEKEGYIVLDPIRKKVWNNPAVSFFYAQNMLVYVRKTCLKRYPSLIGEQLIVGQLNIVHPERYLLVAKERQMIAKFMPGWIKKLRMKVMKVVKVKVVK